MDINIEATIATRFIDAIKANFSSLSRTGDVTLRDWYVTSSNQQRYGPEQLHRIPQNRVFGVQAHVEGTSFKLSLLWDGLEQSVIAHDESKDPEVEIGEFRQTNYETMPGYGSLEAAVVACRKEVEEYLGR